jgi:hypothetical protein
MPSLLRTVSLNVRFEEGRKEFDPQREHRNITRMVIDGTTLSITFPNNLSFYMNHPYIVQYFQTYRVA